MPINYVQRRGAKPQTTGQVETDMRTIGFILSLGVLIGSVSAAGSADSRLHAGLFAFNGSPVEATVSVQAPMQLAMIKN